MNKTDNLNRFKDHDSTELMTKVLTLVNGPDFRIQHQIITNITDGSHNKIWAKEIQLGH